MTDPFETALQLQQFCDARAWHSCFIGGVAVQRWSEPRVTRYVDLTLLVGFGSEQEFIEPLLAAFIPRISDAAAFAQRYRVLLLQSPGAVGIDISLAALPFEQQMIQRASLSSFAPGLEIRTCSAEDLIVLKLFASRPLDLRDAEGVVLRHNEQLDWQYIETQLRPLAEAKDDPRPLATLAHLRSL